MNLEEKQKIVNSLENEDALRKELIIPLFRKMGYENVYDNQGQNERGNDVILQSNNQLGRAEYIGIILKKGNVTKRVSDKSHILHTIETQVKEAYQSTITHPKVPNNTYINQAWVVTSGTISNSAESYFEDTFKKQSTEYRGLEMVPGSKLIELLDRYWPEFYTDHRPFLSQYQSLLKDNFTQNVTALGLNKKANFSDLFIKPLAKRAREFGSDEGLRNQEAPKDFNYFLNPRGNKNLIIGEGGSGKSTFLKNIAIQQSGQSNSGTPIYIEAKELIKHTASITTITSEALKKLRGYNEESTPKDIQHQKVTLLVDALDEVDSVSKKIEVFEKIDTICNENKDVKIIVTSRHESNPKIIDKSKDYHSFRLLPMQYSQMRLFFNKWFDNATRVKNLIAALNSRSVLEKLPKTPMVLTLLAAVYEAKEDLPNTLTELYAMFTDLMVGTWDQHKNIKSIEDNVINKSFLSSLAYELHSNSRDSFSPEALEYFTQEFLQEFTSGNKNPEQFLEHLINRTCLLKRDNGEVKFQHHSFQEYFSAKHIFKQGLITNNLSKWLPDEWWSEVIFFSSGMIEDVKDLLPIALEQIKKSNKESLFNQIFTVGSMLQSGFMTNHQTRQATIEAVLEEMPRLYEDVQNELGQHYQVSHFMVTLVILEQFSLYFSSKYLVKSLATCFESKTTQNDAFNKLLLCGALSKCNGIEYAEELGTDPELKDPILMAACDFLIENYNQKHEISKKNHAQRKLEKRVTKYVSIIKKDIKRALKPVITNQS